MSAFPSVVEESCHARIGLMGNPSDGFRGKTLSFLLANFKATVRIEARDREHGVEIAEPVFFDSLDALCSHSQKIGYSSGLRLLQATCKVFTDFCNKKGLNVHRQRGFRMTYETDIPRMVGLSGSSAIVVATFRALLKFYGLSIVDLGITKAEFPQVILNIEKIELGISAGLQDRVIQTYGGVVHMDFSPSAPPVGAVEETGLSPYTPVDPQLLPELYLAYDAHAGGDSGAVHSTVRARWESQDPELVAGMAELGGYADAALACLKEKRFADLAALMDKNFAMRLKLYGPDVVGRKNLAMIALAKELGFSAKFTGSGGALVCLRSDGSGFLDAEQEERVREAFHQHGFNFVRVSVAGAGSGV